MDGHLPCLALNIMETMPGDTMEMKNDCHWALLAPYIYGFHLHSAGVSRLPWMSAYLKYFATALM